jgi:hypothetical protein
MDFQGSLYLSIFKKKFEKIQVLLKSENNQFYFTWRPVYIFYLSRSFLLRMKNISDNSCREHRNAHFISNNVIFFRKYCLLWDNVEKYYRARKATNGKMAHAHCMPDTKLLTAFPLLQWLHERAPMVRYTYFVFLVLLCMNSRTNSD